MTPRTSAITATSDVARDIIQNSDYFTSVGKAVSEYVWNSVDYCKPRARVTVRVAKTGGTIPIRERRQLRYRGIVIDETKNGSGMTREDLRRFFTMHGETQARREGRRVRGRFGTGKAAAFGIARSLIIDTSKAGKRNVVRLSFEDLRPGQDAVPVEELLIDQSTERQDGTTVVIDRLKLRRVKLESLKGYLRRSLGRHLRNHDVYVAGELLGYSIPETERSWTLACPQSSVERLGRCELHLSLARAELSEEEQGIAVLSGGYPIEILSLEKFGRWADRLFGEIDVPLLDSQDSIPTFDNTRSRLNRDNDRVRTLLSWIDSAVREVSAELEKEARSRLSAQDQAKLRETAKDIEELLNEDFAKIMEDLPSTPVVSGVGALPLGTSTKDEGGRVLISSPDGKFRVEPDPSGQHVLLDSTVTGSSPVTKVPNELVTVSEAETGIPASPAHVHSDRPKPKGGFKIVYLKEGVDAARATYVPDTMEIRINLEHPELAVYRSVDDPNFKAFSAEIAISEYAIATVGTRSRLGSSSTLDSVEGALGEVRKTVNRLGRGIAPLLSRWLEAVND